MRETDCRPTAIAIGEAPAVTALGPVPSEPVRPAVLESSELLRGARVVEIRHNGELYRLQATRLGKLILTK